jgi:DNA-binding NtrC family response regulator
MERVDDSRRPFGLRAGIRTHSRREPFYVVVLDLTLPDGEETELVAEIRQHRPEMSAAVSSARDDVGEAASKAGATISKETPLPDIISSPRQLAG